MLDVMHDGASGVLDSQLNVRGQLAQRKRREAEDEIAFFEDATNVGAHCALQTDESRCMQWVSKQQHQHQTGSVRICSVSISVLLYARHRPMTSAERMRRMHDASQT
jgi:hypothetical protein